MKLTILFLLVVGAGFHCGSCRAATDTNSPDFIGSCLNVDFVWNGTIFDRHIDMIQNRADGRQRLLKSVRFDWLETNYPSVVRAWRPKPHVITREFTDCTVHEPRAGGENNAAYPVATVKWIEGQGWMIIHRPYEQLKAMGLAK